MTTNQKERLVKIIAIVLEQFEDENKREKTPRGRPPKNKNQRLAD